MRFIDEALSLRMLERWVRLEAISLGVLRLGVWRGYLGAPDAIQVALRRLKAGVRVSPLEEELALLLPDETDRAVDLLSVGESADSDEFARKVWLYVGLRELRDRWDEEVMQWEQVAELIEQARRPEPYARFIYYEPRRLLGRRPGLIALLRDLDEQLAHDHELIGV